MARRNRPKSNRALSPSASPATDAALPPAAVLGSSGPRSLRRPALLAAAVLALAAVVVYRDSFTGVFVLDDRAWILDNASIQQPWRFWPVLFPPHPEIFGGRPVVSLTLALNYWLGRDNVWGYHAVNLTIHILAAWTLFGIIRRTLLLPSASSPLPLAGEGPGVRGIPLASAATPLAFAAALLWTVHPLQTGAVTYIIQRMESLVSLFYLLTLYCVIRGATSSEPTSSEAATSLAARAWYVAAALACALGMATKEVMATAPLVVLLYDRTFLSGSFRKALALRWGLYLALAAGWGVVAWLLVATNFHAGTTGFEIGHFTAWTYFLTQPGVLAHYLRLAFWPTGLCFLYDWPRAVSLIQIAVPGLLIVGLLALTVWALVRRPPLGFLGAWFFLILSPTSGFVPILDAAFEHRMYLALAALAMGAVLAVYALVERFVVPRVGALAAWAAPMAALAAATVALGWATVRRNEVYQSDIVLWQQVVDQFPNHFRAHDFLGLALDRHNKTDEAVAEYQRSIQLETRTGAHRDLAGVRLKQGRLEEAIFEYQIAEQLEPRNAEIQSSLGLALRQQGKIQEAVRRLRKAAELEPDYPKYRYAIAWLLATNPDPRVRNGREAVQQAEHGVWLADGNDPAMLDALAAAYAETGQFSLAAQTARQAIELATQQDKSRIAEAVRMHLHFYESELPFREP